MSEHEALLAVLIAADDLTKATLHDGRVSMYQVALLRKRLDALRDAEQNVDSATLREIRRTLGWSDQQGPAEGSKS